MSINDKSMKKPYEIRAEYRRENIGEGIRGKHCAELDGKSMLPVDIEGTESFIVAVTGTLSDDLSDEITDDDLGTDVPRHEMDW